MAKIGIFDSGVGGLSVYKELKKSLPGASFIYYSDNANCPYGDKSIEFIRERAREISRLLISKGADVILVACNTATSAAIETLRAEFELPFVGMEPAVKPAALGTVSGTIGVLATAGTLKGSKYLKIKSRFDEDAKIVERVGEGFVELVENGEFSGAHAEEVCRKALAPLLEVGADRIVLGCTHYPFLLETLQKTAAQLAHGRDIQFINPAPAVAQRTCDVLGDKCRETEEGGTELISSGSPAALRRTFDLIN